jgi:hypothetical protein
MPGKYGKKPKAKAKRKSKKKAKKRTMRVSSGY